MACFVVPTGSAPFVPSYHYYVYPMNCMTSDETLVSSYIAGDADAFTELYERYVRRIYDFVYFKTHHQQTAEDITSQTFLQVIEKISTFNPKKGNFSAWVHRIARNLTFDHFRGTKPTENIEDIWSLSGDDDLVKNADTSVKLDKVREVLQTLNAKQREVVLLRLWHGYAFKEIADITGGTEAACKMQYRRGMENVRKELMVALFLLLYSL